MVRALSLILVITLAALTNEQNAPPSPFPQLLAQARTKPGKWQEVVRLSMDSNLHTTILIDDKEIRDADVSQSGSAQDDQLFIQYNPLSQPPKLQAIKLNGKEIYNANKADKQQPAVGGSVTNTENRLNQTQRTCEEVVWNNPSLVSAGSTTTEDQYVGYTSIYQRKDLNLHFVCSGTLVSRQHVVTAAHCITFKGTNQSVDKSTILVFLGKYDQGSSDAQKQIRQGLEVDDITLHPEFVTLLYSNDLSVLKLRNAVSITDRIRPVCLWPLYEGDLNKVIGKRGLVVGREFDNRGVSSCVVEMPIVTRDTCIKSKPWFFEKYLAVNAYCGYTDDPGCAGGPAATGSGMIFNVENTWYLRGFVSFTVSPLDDTWEEGSHYVVFTDVAQFVPWIKTIIRGSD